MEGRDTLDEIYFDQSDRIGNSSLAFTVLVDDAGEGDVGRKSGSEAWTKVECDVEEGRPMTSQVDWRTWNVESRDGSFDEADFWTVMVHISP